jgi:hypothetical protein
MLNGLTKEVQDTIKPIDKSSDDIFLSCASFEKRCRSVVEKLDRNYCATTSFVFKYEGENKTNRRDINFKRLMSAAEKHSKSAIPVVCDHQDPLDGVFKFKELCERLQINMSGKSITIDISTFTKQYLLVFLKFIEKQNPRTMRLFYAEPAEYAVKWRKPLSYGLIDIVSVPSYGGHTYIEKENLLVLLLGYEGDRAYTIWEKLSPHKTIILIGKPSYKDSWEGRVEEFNKKLLSKLPKDAVIYIPSLNPFGVRDGLEKIFADHQKEYNIALSPLGPKPQVVGCYLALKNNDYVQVLYAIPKYYEEKYFSKDTGKIWEYC